MLFTEKIEKNSVAHENTTMLRSAAWRRIWPRYFDGDEEKYDLHDEVVWRIDVLCLVCAGVSDTRIPLHTVAWVVRGACRRK